jgi:phenol/toluene 2-monooxygenase (NADH) P4/A4
VSAVSTANIASPGTHHVPAKDAQPAFAQPLLYIGWDEHMMFCAPLAVHLDLELPFGALISEVLPTLYAEHPDFARIDWSRVQWFRGAALFTPDPARALAQQGLKHQSVLRFRTPGLEGIRGSCG